MNGWLTVGCRWVGWRPDRAVDGVSDDRGDSGLAEAQETCTPGGRADGADRADARHGVPAPDVLHPDVSPDADRGAVRDEPAARRSRRRRSAAEAPTRGRLRQAAGLAADPAHGPQGRAGRRARPRSPSASRRSRPIRPPSRRSSTSTSRTPNLPFDQTLLKVDPNLKYSELMKVDQRLLERLHPRQEAAQHQLRRAEPRARGSDRAARRGEERSIVRARPSFFRGSGVAAPAGPGRLMVAGWAAGLAVLGGARPGRPSRRSWSTDNPEPVVPDRSIEFESVTDRTPMSFRDNAAYALPARTGPRARRPPSWPARAAATSC